MEKLSMLISMAAIFLFLFIVSAAKSSSSDCKGECFWEEEGSEIHQRVLWASSGGGVPGKKYISYEALKGDTVPCDKPGVPYYNCRALPTANPYSRGCSVITGCARGLGHP